MGIIKIDTSKVLNFVNVQELEELRQEATAANRLLHSKKGAGSEFLGWVDLPSGITEAQFVEIERVADSLRRRAEVVIVIGIGGSYLGTKAVLKAMSHSFDMLKTERENPIILFAGQNISEDYTHELLEVIKERSIAVVVISKSGTTTEPAIAFRILKNEIERRYGEQGARERIVAVTDAKHGALKALAESEGYDRFVIPDDVGGRFSVFTPVSLLPLAVAGVDIRELMRGAAQMEVATAPEIEYEQNSAEQYAVMRNALYRKGYKIEILASYEPKLQQIGEWWKQLYGESEGKEGKGLFPASVTLTTDLHSMGQYIQAGERTLFETVISVAQGRHKVVIAEDEVNLDGLNYIAGKRIGEINRMAEIGVALAHVDGGVPNIRIELPRINEYYIGALLYLFEKACGISGYMLGVNPFDQPGVEEYKRNMFALLDKPGFEKESEEIRKRL